MNSLYLFTFLSLLLFTCSTGDKKGKQEADIMILKDEVFEIHDEVMLKLGDLRRVKKSLLIMADSIGVMDSTKAIAVSSAIDQIDDAHEGMMNWMRNFDPDSSHIPEEALKYLALQKEAILKVRKDMLASLTNGEKMLLNNSE